MILCTVPICEYNTRTATSLQVYRVETRKLKCILPKAICICIFFFLRVFFHLFLYDLKPTFTRTDRNIYTICTHENKPNTVWRKSTGHRRPMISRKTFFFFADRMPHDSNFWSSRGFFYYYLWCCFFFFFINYFIRTSRRSPYYGFRSVFGTRIRGVCLESTQTYPGKKKKKNKK